jgi:threonine/homoserine/homoserine lactone efflux protein
MILQDWFYLGLICFLGACSPGPSLMVVLGFVSSEGKKSGFSASIGHGIGVFLYALLSTLGLGVLIAHYYNVFTIIQVIGAFFLLWIAFKIAGNSFKSDVKSKAEIEHQNKDNRFFEGFLVAVLNPKIGIFFISLFSQFLSPDQTIIVHSLMALMAGGIDTLVYCTIVSLASIKSASNFLEKYRKEFSLLFAFLLILLAFSLFFSMIL